MKIFEFFHIILNFNVSDLRVVALLVVPVGALTMVIIEVTGYVPFSKKD